MLGTTDVEAAPVETVEAGNAVVLGTTDVEAAPVETVEAGTAVVLGTTDVEAAPVESAAVVKTVGVVVVAARRVLR
ncbi:MAG: hypothetical protein AB7N61_20785 [Acidimicrobiia bacterium]